MKDILVIVLLSCAVYLVPNVESVAYGGERGHYSDTWLMETDVDLDERDAEDFVAENGFNITKKMFSKYYILKRPEVTGSSRTPHRWQGRSASSSSSTKMIDSRVKSIRQLQYLKRYPRSPVVSRKERTLTITDSEWANMWHLVSSKSPSMGVYDSWAAGYTGQGVRVAVLDDGVEPDHTDLAQNYDSEHSVDFIDDDTSPGHTEDEYHGTWCAGIVSAVKNDECVLGVAYDSTFSALKVNDNTYSLSAYGESVAFTTGLDVFDIYTNSYGPSDDGDIFAGPEDIAIDALRTAVTDGRNGKGAIFTWAAGNGGQNNDDCNADGYSNSIYTIAVTSVAENLEPAYYSEQCTAILAGTYSGVPTVDVGGACADEFHGTSASCPMAAGVIALVLQANLELTWRDVQHLIVETSTTEGLLLADWQTNGAGKQVSHSFGFGLMNAGNMIDQALTWIRVPEQVVCETETLPVNIQSPAGSSLTTVYTSSGCNGNVQYLEHVQIWISFSTTDRDAIQIDLTSPEGTRSRLLRYRTSDYNSGSLEWTFMTVHSWGEQPAGEWSLSIDTFWPYTETTLTSWNMTMYGTSVHPITGTVPSTTTIADVSPAQTTGNVPTTTTTVDVSPTDTTGQTNMGPIVGGALGGCAGVGIIIAIVYMACKSGTPVVPIST